MRYFFLLFFSFSAVSANTCYLNPWSTGPLFSFDAVNTKPGQYVIQPYLNLILTYGKYNDNYHQKSTDTLTQINTIFILQGGITSFLDYQVTAQTYSSFQNGSSSTHFGDTSILVGLQLFREKLCTYKPNIRLIISESIPTGKYDNLSTGKLGLSGQGAYETTLGLIASKLFYPSPMHPLSIRFNFLYTIASKFTAYNIHLYGGEKGAIDKIHPGNEVQIILSPQYSLTQNWVLAADVLYNHTNKTFVKRLDPSIKNTKRTTIPSQDLFSLAPAIEYNYSANFGILGGVWFSVIGRNTDAFVSPMFSLVYVF